ncbi:hypothetical protein ABL78_3144 [Leptomonas seymouri]|uniref:Arrestin-like N-terminal domain-containing protein n=1 Tax=Leptomonas seymouri TaxID=5684 RepID=A0A0N0P6L7_LEPSE|nr:hypothetical protein ABL78_3144 [Leptomonas seymouri]|eukprot:KPI87786.1 hypothetical protein ABL78_3144 [Leptomonas seymouri]
MLLDKDKVRLHIDVNGNTRYQCGQAITGCLKVEVLKDVQVTAIRLLACGKETTSFTAKKSGHGKKVSEESYIHYHHLITFFGFSKESGRTGGASLAAGSYEYPFQFVIPPSAPPSYRCCIPAGKAEMAYILRATVDIPHGFNGSKQLSIVVLPTISQLQYEQLRNASETFNTTKLALSIDPGCCGKYRDPEAALEATIEAPMIALLESNLNGGNANSEGYALNGLAGSPSSSSCVRVRLTLRNLCRKAHIRNVRVVLCQHQRLMAQGNSADGVQTIAKADVVLPHGELIPRSVRTFDVALHLPDAIQHTSEMSRRYPLPTMETLFLQVSNFITVTFPGLEAETVLTFSDAMPIVAAIDSTNSVPMIPFTHCQNVIYPEDKLGAE